MSLAEFARAAPKVELHVHLEGTVQPETLLALAQKNGVALPASDAAGLRRWYTFRDFDHFVQIYGTICRCLQTPEDFTRIVVEYGQQMAAHHIRYAEVTWSPTQHARGEAGFRALLDALNRGRTQAERELGVRMRWIPDIVRCVPDTAAQVAAWCASDAARAGGVVALGLGGPEVGWPPERFADAFRAARERGLPGNPHAGETVGPASVWGALRDLRATRIGHGVRAVEDPALLAELARRGTPLEVCPTSNLCLGVAPSYAAHPLRQLAEAGVCVTIHSDDPALFNTTLSDEYAHAAEDCGLPLARLEQAALDAARTSYLPPVEKAALLAEIAAGWAQARAEYGAA